MTDEMMSLRGLLEKSADADVLRDMIGFGAERLTELEVGALTGAAFGEKSGERLVMPEVSTGAMSTFLAAFAQALPARQHAVLVLDRAGWHGARALVVPPNVTLVPLPPYSPELNPVERVWLYLRERFLSHRVLDGYDAIVDACCQAWNALTPDRLRSLTLQPWIQKVIS